MMHTGARVIRVFKGYAETVSANSRTRLTLCWRSHDYANTAFSNFAIEYHRKNEKVRGNRFARSYGAHVESFKQKNYGRKSRNTVPLNRNIITDILFELFIIQYLEKTIPRIFLELEFISFKK